MLGSGWEDELNPATNKRKPTGITKRLGSSTDLTRSINMEAADDDEASVNDDDDDASIATARSGSQTVPLSAMDSRGVIPRCVEELFQRLEQKSSASKSFDYSISMISLLIIMCR